MKTAGLFLDLDGTVADSLLVMRQVYDRFLRQHQRLGSEAEFNRLNGPPLAEVVASLAHTHGLDIQVDILVTRYLALIEEAYAEVVPREGARELLVFARDQGLATAIVTSNTRVQTMRWLVGTGLHDLIDHVVAGDEVTAGKPDPEPYLAALRRSGCHAGRSLAIEDSPTGAASAMGAGLSTLILAAVAPPPALAIDGFAAAIPHVRALSDGVA